MESVYLETTIISYLVARPSWDLVLAAHQSVTRDWWKNERSKFRCVVSDEVVRQAGRGDPATAARRLAVIAGLEVLGVSTEMRSMAMDLVRNGAFPRRKLSGAIHTTVAMHYRVSYLLTWNCRHMANMAVVARLERFAQKVGGKLPRIGTPLELSGDATDVHE